MLIGFNGVCIDKNLYNGRVQASGLLVNLLEGSSERQAVFLHLQFFDAQLHARVLSLLRLRSNQLSASVKLLTEKAPLSASVARTASEKRAFQALEKYKEQLALVDSYAECINSIERQTTILELLTKVCSSGFLYILYYC